MARNIEPGSLLRRYQAGEHEAVWADMMTLGAAVREAPHAEDAWAVARETMRRARHNVELIIRRLDQLRYQFWNGEQGTSEAPAKRIKEYRQATAKRLAKKAAITDHLGDDSVFSAPGEEDIEFVGVLESRGLILPLSLRAWFAEVGDVNLAGAHPALCFWHDENFPGVYADPLIVVFDQFLFEAQGWLDQREAGNDPGALDAVIAWNAPAKARLAAANEPLDGGYAIALPNSCADAPLEGEPHEITFVEYLRLAFRWGGFPGWEHQTSRPEAELKLLTEDLLPI